MCLCHDCEKCEEILFKEGEIEFNSDDEDDEEEWTFFIINVINVLIHCIYIMYCKSLYYFFVLLFLLAANGFWQRKRLERCKNALQRGEQNMGINNLFI